MKKLFWPLLFDEFNRLIIFLVVTVCFVFLPAKIRIKGLSQHNILMVVISSSLAINGI